jgi:hypothetical protein
MSSSNKAGCQLMIVRGDPRRQIQTREDVELGSKLGRAFQCVVINGNGFRAILDSQGCLSVETPGRISVVFDDKGGVSLRPTPLPH